MPVTKKLPTRMFCQHCGHFVSENKNLMIKYIGKNPGCSIYRLWKNIDISFKSVYTSVMQLEELGFIKIIKTKRGKGNKLFRK